MQAAQRVQQALRGFPPPVRWAWSRWWLWALALAVAAALVGFWALRSAGGPELVPAAEEPGVSSAISAPTTPVKPPVSFRELLPLLTRSGNGPRPTTVDVVYTPPIFFQVGGEEAPRISRGSPTAIFLLLEAEHDHQVPLGPGPLKALLRVDGIEAVAPYEVTVLDQDPYHRTSRFLFPLPPGVDPELLNQEKHALTLIIPLGPMGQSTFTWELPLGLPGEVSQPDSSVESTSLPVSALSRRLSRTRGDLEYSGRKGIQVETIYATPEYFRAALPLEAASRFLPDRFTIFAVAETLHTATLPGAPPTVSLRLDGREYNSDLAEQITTSSHHRVTLVRFPVEPPTGLRHRVMELLLPGDSRLTWHFPMSYAGLGSAPGFGVWILAVLGGLVAAMWPCLFQLTVFFIPALAGLSMQEAGSSVTLGRRATVVKAALFFVLGFTLVYTVAGAVIGFAAGRLGDTSSFYVWQRYLGIVGGSVIILLALRVAAQVRAPLVCKMPVLSHLSRRRHPANPLEMMVAGLAFATGCMTCFGAALVVAMVMYVGLSGSALVGAFTLFLFSIGMGIPLVIGAMAMAKVLPLLSRFEKVIRWMGLASSLIMVGFAVLLITGNYMALTEWAYRLIPPVAIG